MPAPSAGPPRGPPSPPTARRLFIALCADAPLQQAVDALRRDWAWPRGARPVVAPDLHVTLHFLGGVDAPVEARLREALGGVRFAPLALQARSAVMWPRGIVVLPVEPVAPAEPAEPPEPIHALAALHRDVAERLARLGLPVEARRYAPHLTLARHAAGLLLPPHIEPIAWTARAMSLVWSRPQGLPRYEAVAQWPARE